LSGTYKVLLGAQNDEVSVSQFVTVIIEDLPIEIELEDLSIIEVTDTDATLEIVFKVSNPNDKSVILQLVKYDIYESGIKLKTGQIGERAEGMVTGSNYFTILNEQPTILRDKITLKNSEILTTIPAFQSRI